ncbi:MAG: class I SAM-dependent methyltransferase [Gordonia sp. (in: high G+C Gram-positive bacteria)]|uniref:class I SAM-dependent methyltransferase n=1 Tax=Gordonia sp. (in: high G+C Gram-positive bacteria) TaxID=84139 RepID=UPI0039E5757A
MDPRTSSNGLIRSASAWLQGLNARHPWSHNDAFISWILRRLPEQRRTAVDVGCGRGELLTRLAPEFDRVIGCDSDSDMRAASAQRTVDLPNVSVTGGGWVAFSADDHTDLDLITMTAVLHHLDTPAVLERIAQMLAPGGRFLVVGLARRDTVVDHLWDYASMVTNPIIGIVKHPRPVRGAAPTPPPFPVKDPDLTYTELRGLFDQHLPGTRLRRRLGFRYTAEWTKPADRS